MKIRIAIAILALACLAGYVATVWSPSALRSSLLAGPSAADVPAAVAALSGVWERMGPDDRPARLVVEDLRGHWATVLYAWKAPSEEESPGDWIRVRALVFPDGTLFWRHPGAFTFQLSEDWTTMVGKREQGGTTTYSLMRRVPEETALTALNTDADE